MVGANRPPSQPKSDCFIENVVSSAKGIALSELHSLDSLRITSNALLSSYPKPVRVLPTGTNHATDRDLGSMMNILQVPKMEFPHFDFHELIVEKLDNLISHNAQVLLIGASLGAAISAGVAIGLFSAVSIMSSYSYSSASGSGTLWWRRISRRTKRWFHPMAFSRDENANVNGGDSKENISDGSIHSGRDEKERNLSRRFRIIQGNISSNSTSNNAELPKQSMSSSAKEQCQQCLDAVTISLAKQRIHWNQILRISVYLVSERCEAKTFRSVLRDYPLDVDTAVSILYVQRLEEDHACVQVEALVQPCG